MRAPPFGKKRRSTWLRDETRDDSATLPHPGVLAAAIVEDLRAILAHRQEIADDLAPQPL